MGKLTCQDLMVGDWVMCNHYQDKPFDKQFGVADFAKRGHLRFRLKT